MKKVDFSVLVSAAKELDNTKDVETLGIMENIYSEHRYYVAFVGQFSAGKSSLLNCLLERDVLPQNTVETTPVLTYVEYGKEEIAKLFFDDGSVQQIPIDHIKDITVDVQEKVANYQNLEHVEICLNNPLLAKGLVLLDTPGINTIIEKHERLLANALMLACRVFYVSSGSPSKVDISKLCEMTDAGFEVSFVRTHCDLINPSEETMAEVLEDDSKIFENNGLGACDNFHVSNVVSSEWYGGISMLRQSLAILGENTKENFVNDWQGKSEVYAKKYIGQLNLKYQQLEAKKNQDDKYLYSQKELCRKKIELIEDNFEKNVTQFSQRIERTVSEVKNNFDEKFDYFVKKECDVIRAARNIAHNDAEIQALLYNSQSNVLKNSFRYINSNIDPLVGVINGFASVDNLDDCDFDIPEEDSLVEICYENDEEIKECKYQLIELRNKIEDSSEEVDDLEEELKGELSQIVDKIKKLQNEYKELGAYVPQMDRVPEDGIGATKIGESIGEVLDWAMMVLPDGALMKVPKLLKGTKILKALNKAGVTTKTLKNGFKAAEKGLKAVRGIQKTCPTEALDYLSLSHWGKKIGECFEDPPRYEENQEVKIKYLNESERIRGEIQRAQQIAFEKKKLLGVYKNEKDKQRAYLESLKVDEKLVSQKLEEKQQDLQKQARESAITNRLEKCADMFTRMMKSRVVPLVSDYFEKIPGNLETYLMKRYSSQKELAVKEREKLDSLDKMTSDEVVTDMNRISGLLEALQG